MGKMEAAGEVEQRKPLPSLQVQTVLRQLSKDSQQGWIERLFSRLAALYGAAFGRQWEGANLSEVKAVWAEKLGGFTAKQIGEAIRSCDDRPYPPNLPEFIDMCRRAAKTEIKPVALDAPQLSEAERIERAKILSDLANKLMGKAA